MKFIDMIVCILLNIGRKIPPKRYLEIPHYPQSPFWQNADIYSAGSINLPKHPDTNSNINHFCTKIISSVESEMNIYEIRDN